MKPTYLAGILLGALCTMAFAGTAFGQSKKETEEFIVSKYDEYGRGWRTTSKDTRVIFEDGNLVLMGWQSDLRKWYRWCEIPLIALNPARIEVERGKWTEAQPYYWAVVIEHKKGTKYKNLSVDGTKSEKVADDHDHAYLYFTDERPAMQVAKAFRHLIELNGGKPELFEP